jgi:hypothetical protein
MLAARLMIHGIPIITIFREVPPDLGITDALAEDPTRPLSICFHQYGSHLEAGIRCRHSNQLDNGPMAAGRGSPRQLMMMTEERRCSILSVCRYRVANGKP